MNKIIPWTWHTPRVLTEVKGGATQLVQGQLRLHTRPLLLKKQKEKPDVVAQPVMPALEK